ncbi:nuclear transport factor 2 family protein [Massilia norwichensis]|uniref:Nuclear transport factor 2 family protein n=1 Tax=Massilia norwichensis TaxID=1442366 RepID=A0ABT2AAW2_9BURK|nr:nuclear transport factor 2 family protein [Massilia norwichensis]MCS0591268.1 nuclear transport factor 2 family protein [Massilia norwichensis]
MKRLLALMAALLITLPAMAANADPALKKQVDAFVDSWHDDAAHARMAYFDKMAPDGVYIGTDRSELWQRDAFKAWARKYFEGKKSAWSFKATRRNVYTSGDGKLIWFDELLDTANMGHCMASGVIRKTDKGFEILHYQLSMAVPNEVADQVTELVRKAEATPGSAIH